MKERRKRYVIREGRIFRERTLEDVDIDEYCNEKALAEKHLGVETNVDFVCFTLGKHVIKMNGQGEFMEIDNKPTSEYSKEELSKIVEDISAENPQFAHELVARITQDSF